MKKLRPVRTQVSSVHKVTETWTASVRLQTEFMFLATTIKTFPSRLSHQDFWEKSLPCRARQSSSAKIKMMETKRDAKKSKSEICHEEHLLQRNQGSRRGGSRVESQNRGVCLSRCLSHIRGLGISHCCWEEVPNELSWSWPFVSQQQGTQARSLAGHTHRDCSSYFYLHPDHGWRVPLCPSYLFSGG